jgi:hypothetical protein
MPLYYFVLKGGARTYPDRERVELPDLETAHLHAVTVARELMRNREVTTSAWRVQVCDDDIRPRSEILFADVDETFAHMPAEIKESRLIVARETASMHDALERVHDSVGRVRETLTLADQLLARVWSTHRPQQ